MTQINAQQWQALLAKNTNASILQTAEWGKLKTAFGWEPIYVANETAGAMVLFRKLPHHIPWFTIAYIPRGPVSFSQESPDYQNLWLEIHQICRKRHAIFLRVEPDEWQNSPQAEILLQSMNGFQPGFATIQPPNTMVISLAGTEEDWLNRMNQKTRYNIRLSQKKDLVVEESDQIAAFSHLMEQTGDRDNFGVHTPTYYQKCYDSFKPENTVHLLMVSFEGKPLSALMLFIRGKRGYYLYGASSNEERNRMPNHLLQWTAMKMCAQYGCTEYDLWGIPDESEETLESQFQNRQDGLWSVYRFKRGFGGEIRRTIGTLDFSYIPLFYRFIAAVSKRKKR
jgi:peptidoglycan pentaglycine glycine transferase (the first glycine)